ncbi:MAG: hypothetical protein RL026_2442 [Pseudomonadota bacterium]|jgi:diguanylate cyclase (GGDEF)-like protein
MVQGVLQDAVDADPGMALFWGTILLVLLLLTLLLAWRTVLHQRHKARHGSLTDQLTGLSNRLHLHESLPALLRQAREEGSELAVFHVGIDHFRRLNDLNGSEAGDRVLVETARRLRACTPGALLCARVGSDEFVLVAGVQLKRQEHEALARLLVTVLHAPVEAADDIHELTVSLGVSVLTPTLPGASELLRQAHIAMHEARRHGRNQWRLFRHQMDADMRSQLELEHALRGALAKGELHVVYQPVVALVDGQLTGFEALIRWRSPLLGDVPPGRFIPVAESCGLIGAIGEFVLRQACRQLRSWQEAGLALRPVAVNISPLQFERGMLRQAVESALHESGIHARWLHLELTESTVMQNPEVHGRDLQALRARGCKVSIDDFGTGHSSLSRLSQLPVDKLKIDRGFVKAMRSDAGQAAIIRAIVTMAGALGLTTVAEGIEGADELTWLQEIGCVEGQGFHFSHPLPVEECAKLLRSATPYDDRKIVPLRTPR